MTTPEKLRKRQKRESIGIGLLALALGASVVYSDQRDDRAQVQACENANESRAAQLVLWNFVIDVSSVPDPGEKPPTEAEQAAREDIRDWLEELFAPRDCSDLTREYKIPDPPPLIDGAGD